jgi:hypothetical protein
MSGSGEKQQTPNDDPDLELDDEALGQTKQHDRTLEDTFPASDPPAIGGSMGPND